MNNITNDPHNKQWYILHNDEKLGPFDYTEMIQMMQRGELFSFNYAWAPHLENWTLLCDLQEFSKDRFCRLIENKDPVFKAFTDRRSARVNICIPLFAHNDLQLFEGHTLSMSLNGAMVLLNDPLLLPGQKIILHFKRCEENPNGFNVAGEIINKLFTKQKLNVKSGLHYTVRFLQVQNPGIKQIKQWTSQTVHKEETNGIHQIHE